MKCSCGATKGVTETCYNGYWGYYDTDMATELFDLCNSERQTAQYVEHDAIGNVVYAGNVKAVSGAAWFWYDQDGTGENLIGVAVMEYDGDARMEGWE